jgi:hypothetical protein
MFGSDYFGVSKNEQHSYEFARAWWPTRVSSGKLVWLKKYVIRRTWYDAMGRPAIKGLYWTRTYTQEEYFLKKMAGDI